jgi:hypothetical protein
MRYFRLKMICIAVVMAFGIAEMGIRASGLTDVPAYRADSEIGYIVKPNQSGRFLNKNAWAFNDKSMPTERAWGPTKPMNIMVIGNSIVMGGNPFDQKDKLIPQIEKNLGSKYSVWPVGIGGWTTVNEMAYLARNPDVVKSTNFFIWEYMPGGLSGLSEWRGDYVFPKERPVWATWYVFRRYVWPRLLSLNMSELPPPARQLEDRYLANFDAQVAALCKSTGPKHPGIIFLYPERGDLLMARHSTEWLPERKALEAISAKYGLTLVDVAQNSAWTESLYRDHVHPSVLGNVVLAKIISDATRDTLTSDVDVRRADVMSPSPRIHLFSGSDKTPRRSLSGYP